MHRVEPYFINRHNFLLKQVINSTTSGSHTLLYKACRNGNPDMVGLLLEHGAIARPHYYTKYSPLYIACHMGNLPIAKMILKKFPHLIAVPTIENFLPFHAACSQGHLEILKLLIESSSSTNANLHTVFTDDQQRAYMASFDLNGQDMNGHTGIHSAVLANHYQLCMYLLEMHSLSKQAIQTLTQQKQKVDKALKKGGKKTSLSESESIQSTNSSVQSSNNAAQQQQKEISLFDHFKNVFLDPKSYDPYVINYTATSDNNIGNNEESYNNNNNSSVGAFILSSLIGSDSPSTEPKNRRTSSRGNNRQDN